MTSLHRDGSVPYVLTLHLAHRFDIIFNLQKRHESESFALHSLLVSDHTCLAETRIFLECIREDVIRHFVAHVAAEYSEVILLPVVQGLIDPCGLPSFAERLLLPLVDVLQ